MTRIEKAAQQYSKKLSRLVSVFWVAYVSAGFIVMTLRPETAQWVAYSEVPVHMIMGLNLATYMYNSISEKKIYSGEFVLAWLAKQDKLKGLGDILGREEDGSDAESMTEGESNG